MKKQLLTLGLMLAVCGAYAQGTRVEALTGLNNKSFYTIKSQDRGYLYYDSNNPDYVTSTTSGKPNNGITNDTPTNEATATTEQFAFLRGDYTAAGNAYVLGKGDNGVGLYRPESNKNADGTAGSGYFKNNAGRAYLNVEGVAAPSLVFSFGGVETAIGAVREQSANTTAIYDLSGRRPSAGGQRPGHERVHHQHRLGRQPVRPRGTRPLGHRVVTPLAVNNKCEEQLSGRMAAFLFLGGIIGGVGHLGPNRTFRTSLTLSEGSDLSDVGPISV